MTHGNRWFQRGTRPIVMALAACALAACTGFKPSPPEQPQVVSANSSQVGINRTPSNSVPTTSSQSVHLDDRKPDTDSQKKAGLHLELAEGYYADGKYSVALDELRQSLTAEPNYGAAEGVLALVYVKLGEDQLARQSFARALQLAPSDSDINNNYGWYLCQHGQEAESFPYFLKATENPLYTQPAKPLQNAGICALRRGDTAAAEDYLKRSFERDPSSGVTAYMLSQIYFGRKDYERARFYVALVNKTSAASSETLWLGVRVEHALGHTPEELSLGTQLQRTFPTSSEAERLARHAYDE